MVIDRNGLEALCGYLTKQNERMGNALHDYLFILQTLQGEKILKGKSADNFVLLAVQVLRIQEAISGFALQGQQLILEFLEEIDRVDCLEN